MEISFEQKSLFSCMSESNDECDLKSSPFSLPFESRFDSDNNSSVFDNIYFIFQNQNSPESSKDDTQEKSVLKKNIFCQKKLSGRKRKNPESTRKPHNKNTNDNILRKLNNYILNFLIDFINEVLSKCYIPQNIGIGGENNNQKIEKKAFPKASTNAPHFLYINGQYKKLINKTNFDSECGKKILEILTSDNNGKCKKKDQNVQLLEKIKYNNNEKLKNLLNKTYIEFFKEFYYKKEKVIFYEGLELNLPKNYDYFLEKAKVKEDELYNQKIEAVIQKYFFPEKKTFNVQKTNNFHN